MRSCTAEGTSVRKIDDCLPNAKPRRAHQPTIRSLGNSCKLHNDGENPILTFV